MRKGMLFFSQYRTLRRIFLKNLKKYLRFVRPYRPGADGLPCLVHRELLSVQDELISLLKRKTIQQIMEEA